AAAEKEVAALAEPDVDLELLREVLAERDRLLHEPDVELGRPLLSHAAAVSPRRAGGEIAPLEDDDVGEAEPRQVVGDGQPDDPWADDDEVGGRRERAGAVEPRPVGGLVHQASSPVGSFTNSRSGVGVSGGRAVNGGTLSGDTPAMRASASAIGPRHSLP